MDLLRLSIVDCPIIHPTLYLTLTPKITSNNSKYLTLAMYLTLKTVILKNKIKNRTFNLNNTSKCPVKTGKLIKIKLNKIYLVTPKSIHLYFNYKNPTVNTLKHRSLT